MPKLLHHSRAMHPKQAHGTIVFTSIMRQELYSEISRPYQRILNQESLYIPTVPRLECAQLLPFLRLDRIPIRHRDLEGPEHGAEELEVGEDDGVNEDVVAELDDEELVVDGALIEHVAVFVLDEYRVDGLASRVRL